ncbi:MAG: homoaconitase [Bacteroidales bacterium]
MAQTLIEKILQQYADDLPQGHEVQSGDYLYIRPAYVMTHDNTGAVIPKFKSIGAKKIFDPNQVVNTLDHNVQDKSEKNLEKYAGIEKFAREMGTHFYPSGRGIGHQIMCEEGFAWPGGMAVASDSHSNMYGGLGCLGTPIVRTDAAAVWATGRTWWKVPPIVKVTLSGKLNNGVYGKDVIINLCGFFNHDEVLNHVIEFTGPGLKTLSIDERLSIANMTTEWGALAGVFDIDEVTYQWIEDRISKTGENERMNHKRLAELKATKLKADADAFYAKEITVDLGAIQPTVSGPDSVKKMATVASLKNEKIKINKAYLVSCVNSREEDIRQAAQMIKNKKVAPGVDFYIAAASSLVQEASEASGDWKTLLDAGAIPLPSGCGPCIGLGTGTLAEGEVGISATNRNYKGRMGHANAKAYLASPAVVASSAISGYIDYDFGNEPERKVGEIKVNKLSEKESKPVSIIDGFPKEISGNLLFCYQDNLNTDGIYPGKYTYIDDFTAEQQAGVVMENYDPDFRIIAKEGDILAGAYNFGTGSSREQAATALKNKGIRLVIAGSFSETYKRNALNNGYLIIEIPDLVEELKTMYGSQKLTVNTSKEISLDFSKSKASFNGKSYSFDPIGKPAQELIITGGLENWVKSNLKK